MEKINIAELLKDCPKGMELDCTMYDNIIFCGINERSTAPINIKRKDGIIYQLTKYGQPSEYEDAKCVIFPKSKTTWEGFQRPFKDGDIVAYDCTDGGTQLYIFKEQNEVNSCCTCYLMLDCCGELDLDKGVYYITRLATEEEKAKLFQAIKDNGYKWNEETKTLEKLIEPKFKVGDRIKRKGDTRLTTIKDIRDNCYIITIPDFFGHAYITDKLLFSNQNEYELVLSKFDINTLKPFDKVLVRGGVGQKWTHDFFGFMDKDKGYPFVCVGHYVSQCIPYEGNQHLLGTNNDCDEYFKTWE